MVSYHRKFKRHVNKCTCKNQRNEVRYPKEQKKVTGASEQQGIEQILHSGNQNWIVLLVHEEEEEEEEEESWTMVTWRHRRVEQ